MRTGTIIKRTREDKGLMQKEVSAHLSIENSNYNKLENSHRYLSVEELQKLPILFHVRKNRVCKFSEAKTSTFFRQKSDKLFFLQALFNMTTDEMNSGNAVPATFNVKRKPNFEKLHLINKLQEDVIQTVYNIIDTMLTKQKFQAFFEQN